MEPTKKAERSLRRLLKAAEDFSRDLHAIKPQRQKTDETGPQEVLGKTAGDGKNRAGSDA